MKRMMLGEYLGSPVLVVVVAVVVVVVALV